LNYSKTGDIHF